MAKKNAVFEVLYGTTYCGLDVKPEVFAVYKEKGGIASYPRSDILRTDPIMIKLFKELGTEAVSGNGACLVLYQSDKDYTDFYRIRDIQGCEEIEIDEADYMRAQIQRIKNDATKTLEQKLEEIYEL